MADSENLQPEFVLTLKFLSDEHKDIKFSKDYFNKTVREFKFFLFPEEDFSNKTIKLIYKGHLLEDSTILSTYSIIEKDVLHVVISNNNPPEVPAVNNGNANPAPINENLANNNNNNNNNDFYLQITRQGFEKFCDEQFLEEDVENLREIYHVGYLIDKYSLSRAQMFEKEEILMRTDTTVLRNQLNSIKMERIKKDRGTVTQFWDIFSMSSYF